MVAEEEQAAVARFLNPRQAAVSGCAQRGAERGAKGDPSAEDPVLLGAALTAARRCRMRGYALRM